jgi:hypothetical protein
MVISFFYRNVEIMEQLGITWQYINNYSLKDKDK